MEEIKVGQIWQVITDDFFAFDNHWVKEKDKIERPLKLFKNEYIEIRYAFEWNFRTYDNRYMNAKPEEILKNCKLIGEVKADIRFQNLADLKDILRLNLYDKNEELESEEK